jgi:ligand-binding SRPBCC domain-containing protein
VCRHGKVEQSNNLTIDHLTIHPMRLHLKTAVQQDFLSVFDAFDEQLFRKLSPPYPRLKLLRFDGSEVGDVVEVELQTGIKSFRWTSLITEREITDTAAWFVDEGQELPPPLRQWRHKHLVTQNGTGAVIHDIIDFSTGYKVLDGLLYPLMLAQFSMRGPVYRKVFRH